jgi:integrase
MLDTGRDPDTGRRQQKWFSGYPTKSAAEDALADLLGKRLRGEVIDPDRTPLEEYVTAWIDGRAEELAPLTVAQYRSVAKNHIRGSALGGMPLEKIRRAHIRAHETELQKNGLSAASCSIVRAVLSRSLADAVADDLISPNPCEGSRRSGERRAEPKRFTVWTETELRSLLEIAEGSGRATSRPPK